MSEFPPYPGAEGPDLTPDELERQRASAKKRMIAMYVVAIPLCLAGTMLPAQIADFPSWRGWACFAIGVVCAMPWLAIALVARRPDLYTLIGEKRKLAKADMAGVLIIPGVFLLLGALTENFEYLSLDTVHFAAAAIALGMTAIARAVDPDLRRQKFIIAVVFAVFLGYGYGGLLMVNDIGDAEKPQVFATHIDGKYHTHGKGARAKFTLAPWGPVTERHTVNVSERLYRHKEINDDICVELHPGLLGVQWYAAAECVR